MCQVGKRLTASSTGSLSTVTNFSFVSSAFTPSGRSARRVGGLYVFLLLLFTTAKVLFTRRVRGDIGRQLDGCFRACAPTSTGAKDYGLGDMSVSFRNEGLSVCTSRDFTCRPFMPRAMSRVCRRVRRLLPNPMHFFQAAVCTGGRPVRRLVPGFFHKGGGGSGSQLSGTRCGKTP